MLELHAKDYFSLKYDAAAQNRVSSVSGKNYARGLEKQTKRAVITQVRLMDDSTEVRLPLKLFATSSAFGCESFTRECSVSSSLLYAWARTRLRPGHYQSVRYFSRF